MPNHQGAEGAHGRGLSLPLFHYSPRPDGHDPEPCCVRLRVAPPPPLARLASLEGRFLASPFDCFLHLSARLSWGPVWSGRSLWKLSDVRHPLRWGAVYQLWLRGGTLPECARGWSLDQPSTTLHISPAVARTFCKIVCLFITQRVGEASFFQSALC